MGVQQACLCGAGGGGGSLLVVAVRTTAMSMIVVDNSRQAFQESITMVDDDLLRQAPPGECLPTLASGQPVHTLLIAAVRTTTVSISSSSSLFSTDYPRVNQNGG